MPAPNENVWYKWFPAKALTSLRWTSLTLEQEGFYRRLYDLAALAQPSIRRGWFYEHDRPCPLKQVFQTLHIHHTTGYALVRQLARKGLLAQDENGAWGFPNFARHQRKANLRVRSDGLGSAERDKSGAESGQDRDTEAEAYKCTEAEAEKEQTDARAKKPVEITDEAKLINEFTIRFPKSLWAKAPKYENLKQHFVEALARGSTVKALIEQMDRTMKAGNMAPKPWEITNPVDPHKETKPESEAKIRARKLQAELMAERGVKE